MWDVCFKFAFYLAAGIVLVGANLWYIRSIYDAVTGGGAVVIAPFDFVGPDGVEIKDSSSSLAMMLQTRLAEVEADVEWAQSELMGRRADSAAPPSNSQTGSCARREIAHKSPKTEGASTELTTSSQPQLRKNQAENSSPMQKALQGGGQPPILPVFPSPAVHLQTALLQPTQLKIIVSGVDVSGSLDWLQRQLANSKSLHFTIYRRKDNGVQITGSLSALGLESDVVRIALPPNARGESPGCDEIVEKLAYEIVRRRHAAMKNSRIESLKDDEFQMLVDLLHETASLNRRARLGRVHVAEFKEPLTKAYSLAQQVPKWIELNYLAGSIAISAEDWSLAQRLFQALREDHSARLPATVRENIDKQLAIVREKLSARMQANTIAESTDASVNKIRDHVRVANNFLNKLLGQQLSEPPFVLADPKGMLSYWDGEKIVVPTVAATIPDIVYREASWPHITQIVGTRLMENDDTATTAIIYSYADIFPMVIHQSVSGEDEKGSKWLFAEGAVEWLNGSDLAQTTSRTPLRSFKAPGNAYDDSVLGKDQQVGHMKDFVTSGVPGSLKYINSGILNHAFYLVSDSVTSKRATEIWVAALRCLPKIPKGDFLDFAAILYEQGKDPEEKEKIHKALLGVGLDSTLRRVR